MVHDDDVQAVICDADRITTNEVEVEVVVGWSHTTFHCSFVSLVSSVNRFSEQKKCSISTD